MGSEAGRAAAGGLLGRGAVVNGIGHVAAGAFPAGGEAAVFGRDGAVNRIVKRIADVVPGAIMLTPMLGPRGAAAPTVAYCDSVVEGAAGAGVMKISKHTDLSAVDGKRERADNLVTNGKLKRRVVLAIWICGGGGVNIADQGAAA